MRPDQAFLADYRNTTEKIRAIFERFLGSEADTKASES
jgi:hypothetical protein